VQVFEITGYRSGLSREGVDYLEPSDSFQEIVNGYIRRQVLQSRKGFTQFSDSYLGGQVGDTADGTRVMGIFEHILNDNTTQLLAVTKKFLYKFNTTTNVFDQIANAGGAPAGGFTVPSNSGYISGTTYPTKAGANRFVFTGAGIGDVYFYDGTNVKSFTTFADNNDYLAPPAGALTGGTFISWFGERLNIFKPIINGASFPQGVLYSGIRDSSGKGDQFSVVGSGVLSADTPEYINGVSINGDKIIINFSRSNWTLEKTRDPYNPYFIRKIPSVIGTDAPFSSVTWDNWTVSMGKTGIIATDGNTSKRIDKKIPRFTDDDIDGTDFNLTYGGFDRDTEQFLWAYRGSVDDDSEDKQDKVLASNYEEGSWSTYNQEFSCFGQTDVGIELAWDDIEESDEHPTWDMWDTTDEIWDEIGQSAFEQKTLAGDNDGFVYQLNVGYNDHAAIISGITQASDAVITTTDQSFEVGDSIFIYGVEGMTEINNYDPETNVATEVFTVSAATRTSITIDVNSTEFGAWTAGGIIVKPIEFSAKTVPFNPFREKGRQIYISYVEFLLKTNSGSLTVDVFADEEDEPFKRNVIVKPTGTQKSREWVSMSVNQESDFITFKMSQVSAFEQVEQISMRIHAREGGPSLG
jgi:hypothetical protein